MTRQIALCCIVGFGLVVMAAAEPSIAWRAPIEIASGAGNRGEWRQNESDWDYVDDPTVAVAASGAIAVAWVDQRRKDVFIQIFEPNGKPRSVEPVNITRTPAVFSWLPRIALAPDRPNEIYVLWQEIVFSGGSHGGDIFFARSQDGGATFGAPLNLSKSIGGDGKGRRSATNWDNGSLDLAIGADGSIYAAWTEYHGSLWFSRSGDRGGSFSKPLRVGGDDTRPARAPALATGDAGVVYLGWTVGEDRHADIRVARSNNNGWSFGEPIVAAKTTDYSDAPKLAIDCKGTLHLVYGERSGESWRRSVVHYTRATDDGRTFAPPRTISEPAGLAGFPALSIDSRGSLYVTWELFRNANSGARGVALAISHDGGETFTAPAAVPASIDPGGGVNGSNQGKLMRKLAVNDGAVAVVNSSLRQGAASRVWLIRGSVENH